MVKKAAVPPEVVVTQEAEVAVVDGESKVIVVPVERNDFALRVGCHPLEENPSVLFQVFDSIFLHLTGKLHLKEDTTMRL